MTLSLYLIRRLGVTFAMMLALFYGIVLLFDIVEMVRRYGGSDVQFGDILWMAALNTPKTMYQILPLLAILSAMALFLGLARNSELVVVRGAGMSMLRMLVAPVLATVLTGALLVAAVNPMVAASTRIFLALQATLEGTGLGLDASVTTQGIWLRQGNASGQTVIRARQLTPDASAFLDVSFLHFDTATGAPVTRIEARRAQLGSGEWVLTEAKLWDLRASNPEAAAVSLARHSLPTDLTTGRIRESFASPGTVSVWALPRLITALEQAGFSARQQRVSYHAELAMPAMMAAMLLLGTVLSLRHNRTGGIAQRVLITILAGFGLFFLRNFAQVLGENGQIPILLAIWAPPLASIMLAMGVLLHLEDG
jgi:lipopolysaccharide export system permease protein